MPTLETRIHLPPGSVPPEARAALIELFFGKDPIFKPVKYGRIDGDTALGATDPQGALSDFWAQQGRLTVVGKPSAHFVTIFPNRNAEATWTGSMTWSVPLKAVNEKWKELHLKKVAAAMRILGSPLAYAGSAEEMETKCWRWLDDPMGGQRRVPTLSAPKEGIPGMFWRLFVDPRFSTLMDFDDIQPQLLQVMDDIRIVTAYEDPALAGSETARSAENQLIQKLGANLFYNLVDGQAPSRLPVL